MLRIVFSIVLACLAVNAGQARGQSLETMAGQMVMVGFQGDSTRSAGFRAVRSQVANGQIGGIMYLRPNIASLAHVQAMNGALVAARPWLPPLITIDQEGGQIRRLTAEVGFDEIASAAAIGQGDAAEAEAIYADLARRLKTLGFTVNFGPVVDVDLNPANPIIARYERAFSDDPVQVARFAAAFIDGHHAAGMLTALKHFPGHGSSSGDTHDGFVDVTAEWQPEELLPYRELIAQDRVDMVMVAHIFHAGPGGDLNLQLPASLSPEWIGGVLRGELGYDGVVISDDMQMSAVRERFDLRETIIRAVMAGNDILLFSNTADYSPDLGARIHAILVDEAAGDPVFAARVTESYRRIIALKRRAGIVH